MARRAAVLQQLPPGEVVVAGVGVLSNGRRFAAREAAQVAFDTHLLAEVVGPLALQVAQRDLELRPALMKKQASDTNSKIKEKES